MPQPHVDKKENPHKSSQPIFQPFGVYHTARQEAPALGVGSLRPELLQELLQLGTVLAEGSARHGVDRRRLFRRSRCTSKTLDFRNLNRNQDNILPGVGPKVYEPLCMLLAGTRRIHSFH